MSTAVAPFEQMSAQLEQVLVGGDLSKLTPADRVQYYKAVCSSVGLNPLTKPFEYITLNGKLTLYARKDCTDQLRTLHGVSITLPSREMIDGVYVVTAHAKNDQGRTDESTGAVQIDHLKGEAKANAMMKCETKAKRRVTLSICGLGLLDETEIETIPSAKTWSEGKTAQQEVLARKLAELPAEDFIPPDQQFNAPPETNEPVPDGVKQLWDNFEALEGFDRLNMFKEMKKLLGDEDYYASLNQFGFKKANEIKGKGAADSVRIAKLVLFEMWKRAKAQREKTEVTLEDCPS